MTKNISIIIFFSFLLLFVIADHIKRPALDHAELEIWRNAGAAGACAPCGAICEVTTDD